MKIPLSLKIFLTLALLGALILKLNLFEIVRIFLSLNPFYLIVALFLVLVLYMIRTLRWNLFLRSFSITIPFLQLFKVLLIGTFYGLVTPGKIGELGRAYHISEKKVLTIPTIIMEKLVDICMLVILSLLTIVFFFQNNPVMQIGIFICGISTILGILLLINKKIMIFLTRFLNIDQDSCEQFVENFRFLLHNYPLVGYSFFISLIYYFVAYVVGYLVILSAGFDPIVLITLPIIVLIGNIPITVSGLGLRESIGSIAFVYLGETAANGFVFSFTLFVLISLIPGLCGYFLTMKEN